MSTPVEHELESSEARRRCSGVRRLAILAAVLGVAGCLGAATEHGAPSVAATAGEPAPSAASVPATPSAAPATPSAAAPSAVAASPSAVAASPSAVATALPAGAEGVDTVCAGPGDATKIKDLTCADRKAWFAKLAWPKDCEQAYDATAIHGSPAIEFHPIGSGRTIVAVQCTLGAYQGYSVYLLVQEPSGPDAAPKANLLSFRSYEAPSDNVLRRITITEVWGMADFDDAKHELTVWNRYRGPGDCGLLTTYGFAKDGQPFVKTMRGKNVCDGNFVDPAAWPRVAPP